MTDNIRALLEQALDALEAAKNGLLWYGDTYPDATNDSDDEAMGQIDSALEELRTELAKPPTHTWHDAPEVADLKAQRDELLALLIYVSSEIKSEYPESQWSEYRVFEMEAAIAKAKGGAE